MKDVSGLVSIILPVYNHAQVLPAAIESILSQTYTDWEMLLINDGSTDRIVEAIEPYADHLVVFDEPHRGLPAALNVGYAKARGEFITWTSADNLLLPEMLKELVGVLKDDAKLGAVYSDYQQIDAAGTVIQMMSKGPYKLDGSMNFGPSFLYRGRVAREVGPFDEQLMGLEDRDHALRMAMVAPVRWHPKVLYQYRVHQDSLTGRRLAGLEDFDASHLRFRQKWAFFRDPYWLRMGRST